MLPPPFIRLLIMLLFWLLLLRFALIDLLGLAMFVGLLI